MSPGELTTIEVLEEARSGLISEALAVELGARAERLREALQAGSPLWHQIRDITSAGNPRRFSSATEILEAIARAINAPSSGIAPPGSVPAREASEDAKDSHDV